MPLFVYILILSFFIIFTVIGAATLGTYWDSTKSLEVRMWGIVIVLIFLGLSILWIVKFDSITRKPDFKRVIETESSAVIDTIVTKNSDNSRDTLYIYKFKD